MTNEDLKLYFIIGLLVVAIGINFFIFLPFLQIITIALVASVVCQPIYNRVLRLFGGRSGLSAFVATFLLVILFLLPLIYIGVQVFQESVDLYDYIVTSSQNGNTTSVLSRFISFSYKTFPPLRNFSPDVDQYAEYILGSVVKHSGTFLSSFSSILFNLIIFFISLFYFLKDRERLNMFILSFSPLNDSVDRKIIESMTVAINSVIGGSLAIAIIQGVLVSVGLLIFGVPNAVIWGITACIAALVPGLGTSLVVGPAVIYLLIVGNTPHAIGLLVWGALLVGLIDNFLGPRFIGRKTNIHPLIIFFSVLGGVAFFGPAGFILGPLCVSLLSVLFETYLSTKVL